MTPNFTSGRAGNDVLDRGEAGEVAVERCDGATVLERESGKDGVRHEISGGVCLFTDRPQQRQMLWALGQEHVVRLSTDGVEELERVIARRADA